MPMDGILLSRIINNIEKELPLRINRITQPSTHEFVFQCFGSGRHSLYISTHPSYGRIQFTQLKSSTNLNATHFLTLLRKYLSGGTLKSITQEHYDRSFILEIDHRDDMGVIKTHKLIIELMGKYANMIIVNDQNIIIDAQRRMGSFETESRAIVPGANYTEAPSFNKDRIENLTKEDMYESLRTKYDGVSPILEEEITHRLKTIEAKDIINELLNSNTLYVYEKDYHIIELTHLNKECKTYPIMDGLDFFYIDLLEQERIKVQTDNILKTIKRELKRAKSKLPKLYKDLENNENSDHFKEKGDLLYAFHADAPSGLKNTSITSWDNTIQTIELDEKLNGKQNANRYFIRYRKAKNSIHHLEKQIDLTENRIAYLEGLITQTTQASVEDAKEIQEELIEAGILKLKKTKDKQKQKKNKRPNYLVIDYDENTTIFVGKNNIQNDVLTFKVAKKEDLWFHVAHTHGAHVIIKTDTMDDNKLSLCANLAAYFSNARDGSNVEVQYTEVKNIRKIPGQQAGMVRFSSHNSTYITPDFDLIKPYLNE